VLFIETVRIGGCNPLHEGDVRLQALCAQNTVDENAGPSAPFRQTTAYISIVAISDTENPFASRVFHSLPVSRFRSHVKCYLDCWGHGLPNFLVWSFIPTQRCPQKLNACPAVRDRSYFACIPDLPFQRATHAVDSGSIESGCLYSRRPLSPSWTSVRPQIFGYQLQNRQL
jgi:hypothetical protein